jgi:hypothetical protein
MSITSKPPSNEYDEGYERIWGRKKQPPYAECPCCERDTDIRTIQGRWRCWNCATEFDATSKAG